MRYRRKPEVVKVWRFMVSPMTSEHEEGVYHMPLWVFNLAYEGSIYVYKKEPTYPGDDGSLAAEVDTPSGKVTAMPGDYIVMDKDESISVVTAETFPDLFEYVG